MDAGNVWSHRTVVQKMTFRGLVWTRKLVTLFQVPLYLIPWQTYMQEMVVHITYYCHIKASLHVLHVWVQCNIAWKLSEVKSWPTAAAALELLLPVPGAVPMPCSQRDGDYIITTTTRVKYGEIFSWMVRAWSFCTDFKFDKLVVVKIKCRRLIPIL